MSFFQVATIALCTAINMLDGFDVLVMSFAASSVAKEWDLLPSEVGILLSAGLFGMAIGSIWLAPYADKIGRHHLAAERAHEGDRVAHGDVVGVALRLVDDVHREHHARHAKPDSEQSENHV